MITYSIIQKSKLEGANRFDAEYFNALNIDGKNITFSSNKFQPLDDFIENGYRAVYWNTKIIPRSEMSNDDVYFLQGQNIDNNYPFIKKAEMDGVWENDWTNYPGGRAKKGDILIEVKGKAEKVAVITDDFPEKALISGTLYKFSPKFLPSGYLIVYFLSRYGKILRDRLKTNLLVSFINKKDLYEIPIYVPDENVALSISNQFLKSQESYSKANEAYQRAEKFLLQELGLENFEVHHDLYSVVNFSEVNQADRMDADYFQAKYKKLIEKLKSPKKLGDIVKRKDTKIKIDKEKEYEYTEISDVNVGSGEVSSNVIKGSDLPANAKMKINGGELIISKVRPTRGAIAIIPDSWKENHVASGAFSIFDVPSPMREYLQVVLRSIIGKLQMEQPTTGTSYPTVTDNDVENLLIPILPKQTQEKIADLVKKSHESRKKAKDLLEEAKRKVEELIEKG